LQPLGVAVLFQYPIYRICILLVDHITVAVDEQLLAHVAGEALDEEVGDGPEVEAEGQDPPLLEDEPDVGEPDEAVAHSLGDLAGDAPNHAPGDSRNADPSPFGGGPILRSRARTTSGILAGVGARSVTGAVAPGGQVLLVELRLEVDAWRYLNAIHCVADLRIADEYARHYVHHLEYPNLGKNWYIYYKFFGN